MSLFTHYEFVIPTQKAPREIVLGLYLYMLVTSTYILERMPKKKQKQKKTKKEKRKKKKEKKRRKKPIS